MSAVLDELVEEPARVDYKLPCVSDEAPGPWFYNPRRACRDEPFEVFFPANEFDPEACARAKELCLGCVNGPTLDAKGRVVTTGPCLAYAVACHIGDSRKGEEVLVTVVGKDGEAKEARRILDDTTRHWGGIWGGFTTRERENRFYHQGKKKLWRERRAAAHLPAK